MYLSEAGFAVYLFVVTLVTVAFEIWVSAETWLELRPLAYLIGDSCEG